MERFTGLLGILAILAVAVLLSTDRRAIRRETILWGLGLHQIANSVFEGIAGLVDKIGKT